MPNHKPLKPDDFPVEVEGDELMTADGKPIAKAKTPDIAEDIADRNSWSRRSIPLAGRSSIIPCGQ